MQVRCHDALGAETVRHTKAQLRQRPLAKLDCFEQTSYDARQVGAGARRAQCPVFVPRTHRRPAHWRLPASKLVLMYLAESRVRTVLRKHRASERRVAVCAYLHRVHCSLHRVVAERVVDSHQASHVTNTSLSRRRRSCCSMHVLRWRSPHAECKSWQSAGYNARVAEAFGEEGQHNAQS